MSTLARLVSETDDIGTNVYELTAKAEENRRRDYGSSVKDMVLALKVTRFNEMAVKIQKVWRGYYSRKYVFNYYARQRYLEALLHKNETIRNELKEWEEMENRRQQIEEDEIMKSRIKNWAQGHHHLRGTTVIPGIYNSPYKPIPELETQLILAKPRVADSGMKNRRNKYVKYGSGDAFELNQLESLPPIHEKPQGPFRDPHEVWRQRLKPLKPSLRVQTSYTSVEEARELMRKEEWAARLFDKKLVPFTHPPEKQYQPLLHGSSQYGQIPYGTAYFREEKPERFIMAHNPKHFNTVVPPIEVFEKVNDVY
ncbi:DgyrCDS5514 [Dimorphilus gyrociliatus]|uniref:DgyrCDS5514 n=1 Tax=Dimorphilus gyrociliatus TaxID=2664684 RepID=A0A7I8VME5_9ANNE|nr:DgyrCDS5514 [Dimorphilus gyrociliatus]